MCNIHLPNNIRYKATGIDPKMGSRQKDNTRMTLFKQVSFIITLVKGPGRLE